MLSDSSGDDEVKKLRRKVDNLNALLGTMNQESSLTFEKLENHMKIQQSFNANIMKLLDDKGVGTTSLSAGDVDKSTSELSHDKDSRDYIGSNDHNDIGISEAMPHCKAHSFTQTTLAIDPETSVTLSFVSAGISSNDSTLINTGSKHVISSTPSSANPFNHFRVGKGGTQQQSRMSSLNAERMSPTALVNDFEETHADKDNQKSEMLKEDVRTTSKSPADNKQTGKPPTFPSSTPSQTAPLKSILRTPTHEKPRHSGPLSDFSPSLSPIQNTTTPNMDRLRDSDDFIERNQLGKSFFDNYQLLDVDKNESIHDASNVNLNASLFTSPLRYDSSDGDGDGSLKSLSMLNVTSSTTLASGFGPQSNKRYKNENFLRDESNFVRSSSRKSKKSPSHGRKHTPSDVKISAHYRGDDYGRTSGTSGDDGDHFHTPGKDYNSSLRSSQTTGYKMAKNHSVGNKRVHHSEHKRTSQFWKERLGKRDLTSVLTSPVCQKLF